MWVANAEWVTILGLHGQSNGFILVINGGVPFFCVYLTPKQSITDYCCMINSLENEIRKHLRRHYFLTIQCQCDTLGMPHSHTRERYIIEMDVRTDLPIINRQTFLTPYM